MSVKIIVVSVRFSKGAIEALSGLAKRFESTKVGVIRKGLLLLTLAINEQEAGNEIAVVKDGKIIKEIVGILPLGLRDSGAKSL